ncbi:MAG: Crp/Fnr family transcriptional regulator [Butyrivibrio sp.]|nr:Crp/Fnr family transcriptional regulator [Butyrivibrio sp.]
MTEPDSLQLLKNLPFYDKLTKDEQNEILVSSGFVHYKKGEILHNHHSECLGLIVLYDGRIRVTVQSDEGREITLYFLDKGDIDVLSAACVINQLTFDTEMIADTDSYVYIIPASLLSRLHTQNIYLHSFIYELTANRFSDVMWSMQQILFLKMDQRIANGLLDEYARTDSLKLTITQEELARNISSAREVVARILKRMEQDKLIKLGRGFIEITDIDRLESLI